MRTPLIKVMAALLVALAVLGTHSPARANVNMLILGRRNCESVTAFVKYDGGSVGGPPYLAAFAIDLNGDGVFGDSIANEKTIFTRLGPNTTPATFARGIIRFPFVPEGTEIAVTAYELDSVGNRTSPLLPPVRFTCTNYPQINQIPASLPYIIPNVAVTARVRVGALNVFASNKGLEDEIVGGLALGTVVTAVGRNTRGDWLQILYGNGTGWIMWNTNAIVFGPYKSLPITQP